MKFIHLMIFCLICPSCFSSEFSDKLFRQLKSQASLKPLLEVENKLTAKSEQSESVEFHFYPTLKIQQDDSFIPSLDLSAHF